MNKLECLLIKYILPHSPFGATNFYPEKGARVEVEQTIDDNRIHGGVRYFADTNCYLIPTGASVTFSVNGTEVKVDDYRGRFGHTPGVKIETETQRFALDYDLPLVRLAYGLFSYLKLRA